MYLAEGGAGVSGDSNRVVRSEGSVIGRVGFTISSECHGGINTYLKC